MKENTHPRSSARQRIHRAAKQGDPIALAVVAREAELGQDATRWVYEDFGHDPATVAYLMHALAEDE